MRVEIPNTIAVTLHGLVSRGVKAAEVTEEGHLVLTLTDGSRADLGSVLGPQGARGEQGLPGPKGETGTQGQTGNATGIHTHWEYWVGGRSTRYRQDPSQILGIPNAVGKYDVTWSADNPPGPGPEPPTPGKKPIPLWLLFKLKEVK